MSVHHAVIPDAHRRAAKLRDADALEAELADAERAAATLSRRTPILEDTESAAEAAAAEIIRRELPVAEKRCDVRSHRAARVVDAAAADWARARADYAALLGLQREAAGVGTAAFHAVTSV
jgi:hypothetical protein